MDARQKANSIDIKNDPAGYVISKLNEEMDRINKERVRIEQAIEHYEDMPMGWWMTLWCCCPFLMCAVESDRRKQISERQTKLTGYSLSDDEKFAISELINVLQKWVNQPNANGAMLFSKSQSVYKPGAVIQAINNALTNDKIIIMRSRCQALMASVASENNIKLESNKKEQQQEGIRSDQSTTTQNALACK